MSVMLKLLDKLYYELFHLTEGFILTGDPFRKFLILTSLSFSTCRREAGGMAAS